MTTSADRPADPTVVDFVTDNVRHSCHILRELLGADTETRLPQTHVELRAMPPNFQDGVGAPVIAAALKALRARDKASGGRRRTPLTHMDPVIAAAVKDAYALTMQNLNATEARKKKVISPLLR